MLISKQILRLIKRLFKIVAFVGYLHERGALLLLLLLLLFVVVVFARKFFMIFLHLSGDFFLIYFFTEVLVIL